MKRAVVAAPFLMLGGCCLLQPSRPRFDWDYARYARYCAEHPSSCTFGAPATAALSVETVQFLPWPPPAPSSMVDVTPQVPIQGTFFDVEKALDARLLQRGYDKLLYYGIPGGFAITTPMERFGDAGHPIEPGRFVEGKIGGWQGLWPYLGALLWGERGRFRLFVFAVTNQRFTPDTLPPSAEDIERWGTKGTQALPSAIGSKATPRRTTITLLVYEFEANAGRGGGVVQARDRVPSAAHLRWLGFLK